MRAFMLLASALAVIAPADSAAAQLRIDAGVGVRSHPTVAQGRAAAPAAYPQRDRSCAMGIVAGALSGALLGWMVGQIDAWLRVAHGAQRERIRLTAIGIGVVVGGTLGGLTTPRCHDD